MIKRAQAWLRLSRGLALLGIVVIMATMSYCRQVMAQFPGTGWSFRALPTAGPCEAGLAQELDSVVILDRPYSLTLKAVHRAGFPPHPPLCTITAVISAPWFEVTPDEVQSVRLADGESANLTWTLTPTQVGTHTVNVDWPSGNDSTRHLEWKVGVTDSAFERNVDLTPGQIQKIGWLTGAGLIAPYICMLLYGVLRGVYHVLLRGRTSKSSPSSPGDHGI